MEGLATTPAARPGWGVPTPARAVREEGIAALAWNIAQAPPGLPRGRCEKIAALTASSEMTSLADWVAGDAVPLGVSPGRAWAAYATAVMADGIADTVLHEALDGAFAPSYGAERGGAAARVAATAGRLKAFHSEKVVMDYIGGALRRITAAQAVAPLYRAALNTAGALEGFPSAARAWAERLAQEAGDPAPLWGAAAIGAAEVRALLAPLASPGGPAFIVMRLLA